MFGKCSGVEWSVVHLKGRACIHADIDAPSRGRPEITSKILGCVPSSSRAYQAHCYPVRCFGRRDTGMRNTPATRHVAGRGRHCSAATISGRKEEEGAWRSLAQPSAAIGNTLIRCYSFPDARPLSAREARRGAARHGTARRGTIVQAAALELEQHTAGRAAR